MRRWTGALTISALLLGSAATTQAQEVNTDNAEAAIAAAEEVALGWLELLDAGDIEESWHQAAASFQDAVTPDQWDASVKQARAAVGAPGERSRGSVQQLTDPPNAPPGEYVILQYKATAAEGANSIETVVLVKQGGDWKVTGYFIRPA